MRNALLVFCCWLGLTLGCIPAYANPTNKKITISCDAVVAGDVVTGTATVTVCDSADCLGGTFDCTSSGPISCDSSGATAPLSITMPCASTFRVAGFHAIIGATDTEPNVTPTPTGGADVTSSLTGKGYSLTVHTDSGDFDAVTFTIK
jgi:hypothetical protein